MLYKDMSLPKTVILHGDKTVGTAGFRDISNDAVIVIHAISSTAQFQEKQMTKSKDAKPSLHPKPYNL